jgi:hypothetical protein
MSRCSCGNPAEYPSSLCARCAALRTLELPSGASDAQIKTAYHTMVKVWHPDRFPGDDKLRKTAEERLKAINSAYLVLSVPAQKKAEEPAAPSAGTEKAEWQRPWEPARTTPYTTQPQSPAPSPAPKPAPALRGLRQWLLVLACASFGCALLLWLIDTRFSPKPSMAASAPSTVSAAPANPPAAEAVTSSPAERPAAKAPPAGKAPSARSSSSQPSGANPSDILHAQPYITVGLTRDEVVAIAGQPTSSADDKLVYKDSEIDLKDGKVTGWKIDSATSPLRVKLWPDAYVDSTLRFFSVDSTRNDVLEVQGTPTTLASDMFGYGSSEVYFRNNRVVSWKNDPDSVQLRAVHR